MATNSSADAAGEWSDGESPKWLESLLREAGPPPRGFLDACDVASQNGYMLLKLRRAADQRRAAPWLSAPAYVRALAAAARVPLNAVAGWAGFTPDLALASGFGTAWARFAGAIGLDDAVALLRLRLAFAEEDGDFVIPLAARRTSARVLSGHGPDSTGGDTAAIMAALDEATQDWKPELVNRLRHCEEEFCAARDTV